MKVFAKKTTRFALAGLGAAFIMSSLTSTGAQGQAQPSSNDSFNLPEDISFIVQPNNPNERRATARVNGSIITGTDVDHRVALILSLIHI